MSVQPPNSPKQPPYQPPPIQPLSPQEERTWGMLCHLSALSAFVTGIGAILGPLIVWLIKKDQSAFVDAQGKESVNFQLSCLIYAIVSSILCFVLIGILLLIALGVFWLVEVIIASVAANNGNYHRYPLCIRFIS